MVGSRSGFEPLGTQTNLFWSYENKMPVHTHTDTHKHAHTHTHAHTQKVSGNALETAKKEHDGTTGEPHLRGLL